MARHELAMSVPVTVLRLSLTAWSLASLMTKQMNSVTVSCMAILASCAIFACPWQLSCRVMTFATLAMGRNRSCSRTVSPGCSNAVVACSVGGAASWSFSLLLQESSASGPWSGVGDGSLVRGAVACTGMLRGGPIDTVPLYCCNGCTP